MKSIIFLFFIISSTAFAEFEVEISRLEKWVSQYNHAADRVYSPEGLRNYSAEEKDRKFTKVDRMRGRIERNMSQLDRKLQDHLLNKVTQMNTNIITRNNLLTSAQTSRLRSAVHQYQRFVNMVFNLNGVHHSANKGPAVYMSERTRPMSTGSRSPVAIRIPITETKFVIRSPLVPGSAVSIDLSHKTSKYFRTHLGLFSSYKTMDPTLTHRPIVYWPGHSGPTNLPSKNLPWGGALSGAAAAGF